MRHRSFLILGLALLLSLAAKPVSAQNFGGGGRNGGGFDPDQMFNMLSGGKDVVVRSELTDPNLQQRFDRIAQRLNITDGRITREQFSSMMQGRGGRGGNGGNNGGPGQGQTPGNRFNNPDAMANWADRAFSSYDKNGDGVLNSDEMPESLRSERDKWDTDHNGLIDLTEFRAYFQARVQQRLADRQAAQGADGLGNAAEGAQTTETKPTVYHYGNLPKELPAWFSQLDTDRDAQIGLYEWKVSGRPIEEFTKMDRNGDGFLTVDEVLYAQQEAAKAGENGPDNIAVAAAGDGSGRPNIAGPGFGNNRGRNNGSFNRGGNRGGNGGFGGNRGGNGGNRGQRGPRNNSDG